MPTIFNNCNDFYPSTQDNGIQTIALSDRLFNQGYVVDTADGSLGTCISVLDTNGIVLKKIQYDLPYYAEFVVETAINTNDNTIYGIGSAFRFNDTINDIDLAFMKFTANGDTLFTRIYHDTGSISPCAMVPYYNNTFLVLGTYATDYNNAEFTRTVFMVIDTLGNILKSSFTNPSLYDPEVLIHNKIKNEVYVFGFHKNQPGNNYYLSNFFKCFDDTSFQSKYTLPNITGQPNDYLQSAILYQGSIYATFAVSVWSPPVPFPGNIVKLVKLKVNNNQTLSYQWLNFPPNDTAGNAGTSNILADKGKIIFSGFNSYTGLNFFFCDTLLSNFCPSEIIIPGTPGLFVLKDIVLTKSNKIAGTGMCLSSGINTWNYLSISCNRFIDSSCYITAGLPEFDKNQTRFSLYPNPCSDLLTIENAGNTVSVIEISVSSLLGRSMCSTQVACSKTNILNVSSLVPGLYFVNIENGSHQIITTLKFIKN